MKVFTRSIPSGFQRYRTLTCMTLVMLFTIFVSACNLVVIPLPGLPGGTGEIRSLETFDRLFNDEVSKDLIIKVSIFNWNQLDQTMIDYANRHNGDLRADVYVPADVLFVDSDGEVLIEYAGLRTRGNLSRVRIQDERGMPNMSHFKLSFKETFNLSPTHADYDALRNRRVFELEEIDLKYNRNHDLTYLNEKFSLDLFNRYDVMAQRTTLVNLYVEIGDTRQFYGVYTAFEPYDIEFLQRRFTGVEADGDLYKCLWQQYGPASLSTGYQAAAIGIRDVSNNYRPAYDLKTNKDTSSHSDLIAFIAAINTLEGEDLIRFMDDHFEIDMFLRLLAVVVLLGNPDDYRANANNYYLYHNQVTNTWMMFPYDYDHSLGQGWEGAPVFSNYSIGADIYAWGRMTSHLLGVDHVSHPLVDKILAIPAYQLVYEHHLEALIDEDNGLFTYQAFLSAYLQQQALYDDGLEDALLPLRFGLREIEAYIEGKRADIQTQLAFYRTNPHLRG